MAPSGRAANGQDQGRPSRSLRSTLRVSLTSPTNPSSTSDEPGAPTSRSLNSPARPVIQRSVSETEISPRPPRRGRSDIGNNQNSTTNGSDTESSESIIEYYPGYDRRWSRRSNTASNPQLPSTPGDRDSTRKQNESMRENRKRKRREEKDDTEAKRRKTREEEFQRVEEQMATGISSHGGAGQYQPMIRQGGRMSIGRPHNSPRAQPIPRERRVDPTPRVQEQRIAAFRGQVEADGGFVGTRVDAIFHLRRYNWDVDHAITEWRLHHQRRLGQIGIEDFELQLLDGDEDIEDRRLAARRTGEDERREATELLIERIRERMNDNTVTLTRYEAIGLLHHYRFDIDQAVQRYIESDGQIEDIAELYEPFRRRSPNQRQQDRRTAEFLDITGFGDWYTAMDLLKNLRWDLAKALSMWQQDRVHPVMHPDRGAKGWGKKHEARQRKGFRLKVNCEDTWEQTRKPGAAAQQPRGKTDKSSDMGKGKDKALFEEEPELDSGSENDDDERDYEKLGQEGAPVGPRSLAVVGAPNPALFSVEIIRNGDYQRDRWRGMFRWRTPSSEPEPGNKIKPSQDTRAGKPKIDFDWSNSEHVQRLNTWLNQRHSRLTLHREPDRTEWLPIERDFLRSLHRERKAQELKEDPHCFEKTKKMKLSESVKADWVRRLNKEFAGKVVEGSDVPRPERTWGALSSTRSRMRDICEEFAIKYSDPHPEVPKRQSLVRGEPVRKEKRKRPQDTSGKPTKRKRDPKLDSDDDSNLSESESNKSESDAGPSKRSKRY